jgi:hypothetical protein
MLGSAQRTGYSRVERNDVCAPVKPLQILHPFDQRREQIPEFCRTFDQGILSLPVVTLTPPVDVFAVVDLVPFIFIQRLFVLWYDVSE